MTRTILIALGLACALVSAAGIMWYNNPLNTALRQLHDPTWEVRYKAIETLGKLGAKESAPEIVKILLTDGPEYHIAAETLGKFGNKEAIPHVAKFLHHETAYGRFSGIHMLMDLKAKEFIPEIKKLLEDKNEWDWVHIAAEGALRSFGVPAEEIEEAKKGKLSKYHVIFAHNALVKYNDGKTSFGETIHARDSDIRYENGTGKWSSKLPHIINSMIAWDGIDENGQRIGGIILPPEKASVSLSCFAGDQVTNTSISFSCSGSLEGKKFDEHFTDIKWGYNASFTVQSGDFKMEVDIQPYLCPGCDQCAKEEGK